MNKEDKTTNFKQTSKRSFSALIDSPIILLGRGGSGTRILSGLIQKMGLFLGNDLNESDDSLEWVEPIYNLINTRTFIKNNNFNNNNIETLRLNALNILSKVDITEGFLWGFKLPETMLLLPELKKAFPKARFVHLTRHPVSLSIRRSHVTSRLEDVIGYYVLQEAYQQLVLDFNTATTATITRNNAVSWYYQLSHVLNFVNENLNDENYCQVKYEKLCFEPIKVKKQLIKFLGVKLQHDISVNDLIDLKRINKLSYANNVDEINEVWELCGYLAEKIGYTKMNFIRSNEDV